MLGRRSFMAWTLALAGCRKASALDEPDGAELPPMPPPGTYRARGMVGTTSWSFGPNERAIVMVPSWKPRSGRFPLLVALNGRGESGLGEERGVLAWPVDYQLFRNVRRLVHPPLRNYDFEGQANLQRLDVVDDALRAQPYEGAVVVSVYTPDIPLRSPAKIATFGRYIVDKIVTRARHELPVHGATSTTGITGWSIGGTMAVRIGLANRGIFGAVSGVQPAIAEDQVDELTEIAADPRGRPRLRLVCSEGDQAFVGPQLAVSKSWKAHGIDHELEMHPGKHDYPFIRGVGALEALFWHDRVQRA